MGGLSLTHMLILAIILLLFFGPNKLSDVAKSIGKGVRGFKDGLNEIDVEAKDIAHSQDKEQVSSPQRQQDVASHKEKVDYKNS